MLDGPTLLIVFRGVQKKKVLYSVNKVLSLDIDVSNSCDLLFQNY